MGTILIGISQAMQLTQTLLGSEAATLALKAWTGHFKLTPEQVTNLEANHVDYVEREQRLRAEIEVNEPKPTPPA